MRDLISPECRYFTIIDFANSNDEKIRVMQLNRNIKSSLYPLSEKFLRDYYNNSDYANLKKTFNDVNCASMVYSYFVMSYGKFGTIGADRGQSAYNSSGLNPFGLFNADLGFNLGGVQWLWWLLVLGGVYYITKK